MTATLGVKSINAAHFVLFEFLGYGQLLTVLSIEGLQVHMKVAE